MDVSDAKDILSVVRAEAKIMTGQSQLAQLLAGGEIPDKAMEQIEENQPIAYVQARAAGAIPQSRADDTGRIDGKGAKIYKIVWFIPPAVAVRKALTDKKSSLGNNGADANEKDGAEMVINALDLQRSKINLHKTAITQWTKAAKIIKQEEIAAIHEAKKTKAANIYALGQKMLATAEPIQKVVVAA
jgi:hypothetical protein